MGGQAGRVDVPDTVKSPPQTLPQNTYRVSHLLGLTMLWLFHHRPHQRSHFCKIPFSQGSIGQAMEQSNSKSPQPSPRADGTPCIRWSSGGITRRWRRSWRRKVWCCSRSNSNNKVAMIATGRTGKLEEIESFLPTFLISFSLTRIKMVGNPLPHPHSFVPIHCYLPHSNLETNEN